MTDQQVAAAYARASVALGKAHEYQDHDTPAQRTAFRRWEALDREMARRGLERRSG